MDKFQDREWMQKHDKLVEAIRGALEGNVAEDRAWAVLGVLSWEIAQVRDKTARLYLLDQVGKVWAAVEIMRESIEPALKVVK